MLYFNSTIVRLKPKAAIRAGYSEKTAKTTASRLLTNDDIKKRIEGLKEKRIKRTEITIDAIIEGFNKIAFANKGCEKTSDRLKALEMLGKYIGMFKEAESNRNIIVNHITNLKEEIKI